MSVIAKSTGNARKKQLWLPEFVTTSRVGLFSIATVQKTATASVMKLSAYIGDDIGVMPLIKLPGGSTLHHLLLARFIG